MSDILFFRFDCGRFAQPPLPVLAGIDIEIWRPSGFGLAPACGMSFFSRVAWPALHWLNLLDNRDHTILCLSRKHKCVHRTLLIPPFFRFPFMAPDDLQCGDIWTEPNERGLGLAALGVSAALHHGWRFGRRIWYLTEADNAASLSLARRAGFTLIGRGRRSRRLGLRFLGQFILSQLDESVS